MYVSLKLPLGIACDRCVTKLDPLTQENKKKDIKLHNRYLQYWNLRWCTCLHVTTKEVKTQRITRLMQYARYKTT